MSDYIAHRKKAAGLVEALLAEPFPEAKDDLYDEGTFVPWKMFPSLYGSYCGSFDRCAIQVLEEIRDGKKRRDDLGAEMIREMLCNLDLCDYGSSPRVCFATSEFKAILPELIAKWKAYSLLHWGEDVCEEESHGAQIPVTDAHKP